MENAAAMNKDMKLEIPEVISPGGLARQGSMTKYNCLCSPTTHAGSFRCRLHRGPSLQRTKSIDGGATCQDQQSKVTSQNNTVNAQ